MKEVLLITIGTGEATMNSEGFKCSHLSLTASRAKHCIHMHETFYLPSQEVKVAENMNSQTSPTDGGQQGTTWLHMDSNKFRTELIPK